MLSKSQNQPLLEQFIVLQEQSPDRLQLIKIGRQDKDALVRAMRQHKAYYVPEYSENRQKRLRTMPLGTPNENIVVVANGDMASSIKKLFEDFRDADSHGPTR